MYTKNVEARKARLVRAFLDSRDSRGTDAVRVTAIRKAFWRLVDATSDYHYPKGAWNS